MVKFEWGSKRTCQACAARFYDLRKVPAICPKCGTAQEVAVQSTRSRRGKADKMKDVLSMEDTLLGALDIESDLALSGDADTGLIEDDADLDSDLDVIQVNDESIDER